MGKRGMKQFRILLILSLLKFLFSVSLPAQIIEDFQVNENVGRCNHNEPSIAMDDEGNFVVVWDDFRNTEQHIFGQFYNRNGIPIGSNFQLSSTSQGEGHRAGDVAMNEHGTFIVVWNQHGLIYGSLGSHGTGTGSYFQINDSDSRGECSVDINASGNFVVVWRSSTDGISSISGRRYGEDGSPRGAVFKINDDTTTDEKYHADVAINDSGDFVVVWTHNLIQYEHEGEDDIYCQLYDRYGNRKGDNFTVIETSGEGNQDPMVDIDDTGDFIVVWRRTYPTGGVDTYIQRYDKDGNALGTNFGISDVVSQQEIGGGYLGDVQCDADGNFIVVWNAGEYIYCQRFQNDGSTLGSAFPIHLVSESDEQHHQSIDMNRNGDFVCAWEVTQNNHMTYDIYARAFDDSANPRCDGLLVNDDNGSAEQRYPAITANGLAKYIVVWEDWRDGDPDIWGQGYTEDHFPVGVNFQVSDSWANNYQRLPSISSAKDGSFVSVWRDERNGHRDIYGQRYDSNWIRIGDNFIINDVGGTTHQENPAISVNDDGDYVVVWQDHREDNTDIYGQLYDNDGVPRGSNFKINDNGGMHDQQNPSVAMTKNGDFIVVWDDYRNEVWDVYCQKYSNDGIAQGSNIKINDSAQIASISPSPDIAVDARGDFVVTWLDYSNVDNIFAQRMDSSCNRIGTNFLVNTRDGNVRNPAVDMDENGNFIITWEAQYNDESGIYCQRYNSMGFPLGSNEMISGYNEYYAFIGNPDVQLANGSIITAFHDNRIPGQGYDVFARVDPFRLTHTPEQNALNVYRDTDIEVQFAQDIDPSTLTNNTIVVHGSQSGLHTSSNITYDSNAKIMTFDPDGDFFVGERVTISLTDGIQTAESDTFPRAYSWSFTVETLGGKGEFSHKQDLQTGITGPNHVFVGDFNNDELLDAVVDEGEQLIFYKGSLDGSLMYYNTYYTNQNTQAMCGGDFNKDGYLDIAWADYNNAVNNSTISIIKGNGDGTFTEPISTSIPGTGLRSIGTTDFNNDGFLDFLIGYQNEYYVTVILYGQDESLSDQQVYPISGRAWYTYIIDFNEDGYFDILAGGYGSDSFSYLENDGSSGFTERKDYQTPTAPPVTVYGGDLNNDGILDLAAASHDQPTHVQTLTQDNYGQFSTRVYETNGDKATLMIAPDLDGDGDTDLIVSHQDSKFLSILKNDGSGNFSNQSELSITSIHSYMATGDLDKDGDLDLIVTNEDSNTISIFLNEDSGPVISVTPDTLKFNLVQIDNTRSLEFVVYNTGVDSLLRITGVSSNNDAFTVNPVNAAIPVGDSTTFTVSFTPAQAKAYDGQLTITSNDRRNKQVVVYLSGYGNPVITHFPHQNDIGISTSTNIQATFFSDMSATSFDKNTFVVHSSQNGRITGSYSYDANSKTVTFNPDQDFLVGEDVTVTLTTGIQDASGTNIPGPYVWHFQIQAIDGSGIFVKFVDYPTETESWRLACADFNEDGIPDIAITESGLMIYIGNGDGTFTKQQDSVFEGHDALQTADFNGDGHIDLITITADDHLYIYKGNRYGFFSESMHYSFEDDVSYIASDDVNGDGFPDIALACRQSGTASVLLNNGDGTFSSYSSYSAGVNSDNVHIADVDGNGALDLVMANDGGSISILSGNGKGNFSKTSEYTLNGAPGILTTADLNGDNSSDIAFPRDDEVGILLNRGDGTLELYSSHALGNNLYSVLSSDLDGDGDLDLIGTSHIAESGISLLFNKGNGTFQAGASYSTGDNPNVCCTADFDGDGDIDIAVSNYQSKSFTILLNINSTADIAASQSTIDFGPVLLNNTRSSQFFVYNHGVDSTLNIRNMTLTHEAFIVEPTYGSVLPGDSMAVTVHFTPADLGVYTDTLRFECNDPHKPRFQLPLTGNGVSLPTAKTTQATNVFAGSATLNAVINPRGQTTTVRFQYGETVEYGTEVSAVPGTITGTSDLFVSATITGLSSDTNYHYRVKATNATGTDYGEDVEFNTGSDSPEATTLAAASVDTVSALLRGTVINKRDSTAVFFEYGTTTNYGDTAYADQSPIDELGAASVSTQVTDLTPNTTYHYRVVAVDKFNLRSTGLDEIFNTSVDQEPPQIAHTAVVSAASGQDQTISASLSDNVGVQAAWLFYRPGGAVGYDSTGMNPIGSSTWEGIIASDAVTERGIEYYVLAEDSSGHTATYPESNPKSVPLVMLVTNSDFAFAGSTPAMAYRMISIPFDLDNSSALSVLGDDLGTYLDSEWRLFHHIGGEDIEFGSTGFPGFEAGNGFWLITKESQSLNAGSGRSITTAINYTITLHPGWNQIGTPFAFPVNWSDVVKGSGVENRLVGYYGSLNEASGYDYTKNQLLPWEGYFVFNMDTVNTTIEIPPIAGSGSLNKTSIASLAQQPLTEDEWLVSISAECGRFVDKDNVIGCLQDASDGYDEYDFSEAPQFHEYVSLSFAPSDGHSRSRNYSGDIRHIQAEGLVWNCQVSVNPKDKPVKISVAEAIQFPPDWHIVLIDNCSQVKVSIDEGNAYTFIPAQDEEKRCLSLVAGSEAFISDHDNGIECIPESFFLSQNYPNPFNPVTRMNYELPSIEHVQLIVFNLMGREVRRLFDAEQSAGRYTVHWDGMNAQRQPVSAGVYFIYMKAGAFTAVRKTMVLK